MKRFHITIIFLIICIYSLSANKIIQGNQKIEKFVSEQGFFQNTIFSITSDNIGFLWIGTPNGLVRYDGYSFKYFYHDFNNFGSIPGNTIHNILNDSKGRLWIGTDQGICLYIVDDESFITLDQDARNVTFIKEDPKDRIWVGIGANLLVFNANYQSSDLQKYKVILNLRKDLQEESIVDIEFLNDSSILIATPSGIYRLTYDETSDLPHTIQKLSFNSLGYNINNIKGKDNLIWIGTDNGIFKILIEGSRVSLINHFFFSEDNEYGNININSLFFDKENNLWIGTKRNGILIYDYNKDCFISYKSDPKNTFGLTSNRINCFYEDDFGVIWIGTAQGGLNKLCKYQKPFHNYTHNPYDNQSLSSNLITNITEDRDGQIWISSFDGAICRTDNESVLAEGHKIKFERLEKQLGSLKDKVVGRLFQDSQGYWWLGTLEGLFLYDEKNNEIKNVNVKLNNKTLPIFVNRVIEQINSQQIIIGGNYGYILNNPWKWILNNKPIPVDSVLLDPGKNNSVNSYKEDLFGNLWLGTQKGLFRIVKKNNKYVHKGQINAIDKRIFCIHETKNRDLYIGSFGGGLMKINLDSVGEPKTIKTYHKTDGLPDEVVYGILEDNNGNLWLSTDMGICCFDPINEDFKVFNVNDGILNNNFRQGAFLKTKNGLMLMGGLNGLTVFNPELIIQNEVIPKVIITGLKINNENIPVGGKYGKKVILNKSITETDKITLGHKNRSISLDIIVQQYSTPNKNHLSYMMEGFDNDWINYEGGKTTVTYTNLHTGSYRFVYKGVNGDGIESENTRELFIRVLTPWYLQWWSVAIWVILIFLIIYGIFKYFINIEKLKQNIKFEKLDKERIHEMEQAKLRFFTNITHDFKTPLSLIIGPLEKIIEKYDTKEDKKYFNIIQNNISRLYRLIDQLVSFRKAETSHLEIKYTRTTLGDFLYPLLESFEENAKFANVNFYYTVHSDDRPIVIDIDNTERILLNLYSNAVKFLKNDGEVRIEAGFFKVENHDLLFIEVIDNGIGIPKAQFDKIFERFYRGVDDYSNMGGTGIGLALCKTLIELMNGKISVTSNPGIKTVFRVELPFDGKADLEIAQTHSNNRKILNGWHVPLVESHEDSSDTELPSLMIVDDEQDVRSFLWESLKDKYSIFLAVDGKDALKKLEEKQPQLIISDIMMPNLNGYQLCERIKSDIKTCHIPVILLTALDDDSKMIEGLETGADAYIKKPFSIKHLETRIKTLLENKKRLVEYFSKSSSIHGNDLNMPERDRLFLETIESSINENLSNSNYGVKELAQSVGMSTSHLYRRLKQLTGQVPNIYMRNFRLQKAAELLKSNKGMNVVEVMYEIGIESPSYFSTSFKKMYGVTPSEFIKNKKV